MIVFKQAEALSRYLLTQKQDGLSIGFVPTMGALHAGHLSLIASAKKENALTVCSIFVNPTQFNNADDFAHYPVTLDSDTGHLLESGCDILFLPTTGEIYPPGYTARVYALGELEHILEGQYRPGHFQGVCQVVDRLLSIVQPDNLYMGQKDYQQCMVIETLLRLTGRQNEVKLHILPTLREADGLAMSSRNLRLSAQERPTATALFEALSAARRQVGTQPVQAIKAGAVAALSDKGFRVDYFEIADARTLAPAESAAGPLVALVAAHLGAVRLIDNLPLN